MARWTDDPTEPVGSDIRAARTLPASAYTDPATFETEQSRIFADAWQYLGDASALREPGDYTTHEIAGRPLFVMRHEDGDLRAFYNVCAHRGSKMLEGDGNTTRVRCPYHHWTYEPDGTLASTPKAFTHGVRNQDVEEPCEYDPEANALESIAVTEVGPFVFGNLGADPTPFDEVYEGVADAIAGHGLADLERVERIEPELDCNWKVMVSNYLECDHCHANHPTFVRNVDMNEYEIEVYDRHSVQHGPLVDGDGESRFYYLWPNFMLNIYGDGAGCSAYRVHPVDRETTVVVADYYAAGGEPTEAYEEMFATSQRLQQEDFELVERQQQGVASGAFAQGRLGPNEHAVHHFHRMVAAAIDE